MSHVNGKKNTHHYAISYKELYEMNYFDEKNNDLYCDTLLCFQWNFWCPINLWTPLRKGTQKGMIIGVGGESKSVGSDISSGRRLWEQN
jgi:hypothetical protein